MIVSAGVGLRCPSPGTIPLSSSLPQGGIFTRCAHPVRSYAAAGVKVPEGTDGVSFLPQLKGEAGTPRDWLYTWYSPRQSQDMTVSEYTFNHRFKLYRTGQFYDLSTDPQEMHNQYANPEYAAKISELKAELKRQREELHEGDESHPHIQKVIDENW